MQSDYVSAFGLGVAMGSGVGVSGAHSRRSIRAIDDDDENDDELAMNDMSSCKVTSAATTSVRRTTPSYQHQFQQHQQRHYNHNQQAPQQQSPLYSKSSTMLASGSGASGGASGGHSGHGGLSNLKRIRFNSVETPPTTSSTNNSSSSTDTVTPLHAMAAKAATAVLRRSHSIKQAAQAKRKSVLRSLSHTSSPPPPSSSSMINDELESNRQKYESFCNREEEDDDDNDVDENGGEGDDEADRDADVEDDDDADENESLLHGTSSSSSAACPNSSSSSSSASHHHHPHHHHNHHIHRDKNNNNTAEHDRFVPKDINNNVGLNSSGENSGAANNMDDATSGLKVIIVNNSSVALVPNSEVGKAKRIDSIRMRHHSSNVGSMNGAALQQQDAVSSSSSSSRLKKYFKCRKNKVRSKASQRRHSYIVILLLFVVNLLNYIDRYTLAGVLLDVQDYFGINDGESGLLQTVFICSYMLLAPLFGYLGDRYSRKWIIIFGISFWSLMTFVGSLVPKDQFWLFALIRSLVGIGEASYSCVAPTIIGDLFTNEMRTKMLAVFYLAVPVGSGMGYIVGSNVAQAFNDWRWALRVTPPLGFISVLLLVFVVQEPKRGSAEGTGNSELDMGGSRSNIKDDVIYLLKNKTFMWITFGFTFASFVLGGLSWWVPAYVQYAIYSNNKIPDQIPLKFGVVTCLSGLFGVALSSVLAEKLRKKTPNADPLVCALGSLIAVPALFVLVLVTGSVNEILFWLIAAVAISAMCLSWTIVADVLLYAIYPNRRSIASALNILICHLFGDAGSPYVIGAISDAFRRGKPDTYYSKFSSLQIALYAGPFFAALSFAAYLFTAIYVVEDKKDVDDYLRRNKQMNEAINGSGEEGNDKHFTSSNESTLNETTMAAGRSKKQHSKQKQQQLASSTIDQNAFVNPIALTQEMGTTSELSQQQQQQQK